MLECQVRDLTRSFTSTLISSRDMTWLVALLPTDGDHLRRSLVIVALLSVLSKLALGMMVFSSNPQGVFESSDSHEYHQLALNILQHGSFSQSLTPPLEPETIRTPAYPFLLSGLYHVVGIRPHAVVAIQIALSVVTMLAGCRIASLLFGSRAGLLTAIFLALDPVSLYYSQVMLTETLFGTALTLCLLGIVYALRHPFLRHPSWAGICLALATYTRPTSYYLGMLLPVMMFLAIRRSKGWRPALASAALMLLLFAATVGGWQLRNYVSTGSAQFSQAKNQYLFIAKAAAIIAMRDGISLQEAQQRLAQEHAALLPPEVASTLTDPATGEPGQIRASRSSPRIRSFSSGRRYRVRRRISWDHRIWPICSGRITWRFEKPSSSTGLRTLLIARLDHSSVLLDVWSVVSRRAVYRCLDPA